MCVCMCEHVHVGCGAGHIHPSTFSDRRITMVMSWIKADREVQHHAVPERGGEWGRYCASVRLLKQAERGSDESWGGTEVWQRWCVAAVRKHLSVHAWQHVSGGDSGVTLGAALTYFSLFRAKQGSYSTLVKPNKNDRAASFSCREEPGKLGLVYKATRAPFFWIPADLIGM